MHIAQCTIFIGLNFSSLIFSFLFLSFCSLSFFSYKYIYIFVYFVFRKCNDETFVGQREYTLWRIFNRFRSFCLKFCKTLGLKSILQSNHKKVNSDLNNTLLSNEQLFRNQFKQQNDTNTHTDTQAQEEMYDNSSITQIYKYTFDWKYTYIGITEFANNKCKINSFVMTYLTFCQEY